MTLALVGCQSWEVQNVLVVLESNWNKYDFETLFGKGSRNENVIKRTRKLFYVCITKSQKEISNIYAY